MKKIQLPLIAGFDEWRDEARYCLGNHIPPHDIIWQGANEPQDLFDDGRETRAPVTARRFPVPAHFFDLAQFALRHRSADRYSLLYRILWRICHENKNLLHLTTDDDVLKLRALVKAVRRDAYKIKAFLRFREVKEADRERFAAWYEPEHYSLELSLPFFQTRFRNMAWSILTPYVVAHWDCETLVLEDNPDPSARPGEDNIEKYWLTYYKTTFNPARTKKQAMLTQMPKKYWKNLPEAVLIEDLLHSSETRARDMLEAGK